MLLLIITIIVNNKICNNSLKKIQVLILNSISKTNNQYLSKMKLIKIPEHLIHKILMKYHN